MPKQHARDKRRQVLWKRQSGLCHWCNKPMLHWSDLRNDPTKAAKHGVRQINGMEKIKDMPATLATIDHLRDRFDPARQEPNVRHEQRWVLACWQCNTDRGNQRVAERPIEELHERSRRKPRSVSQLTTP